MTRYVIPKPTDRRKWLAARHRDANGLKYANASDAGTFMGVNKFETLADLAVRYLAAEPPDDDPTEAMDRGNRCEPMILAWYGDRNGVQVITPDVMYGYGRLLSTIDGEPVGVPDLHVEAKSTADYWQEPPESVFWQCVGQAVTKGSRAVDVAWLDASMRFKVHRFVPTDADRDALLARVDEVLAYIDLDMVPEGAHLTFAHVTSLHPVADESERVELSPVELAAVGEWESLRQARIAAKKAEDEAGARVRALLGSAVAGVWAGAEVVSWKNDRPSERVDWKSLEADHPDVVDAYRRVVPGARKLLPRKPLARFLAELDAEQVEADETAA